MKPRVPCSTSPRPSTIIALIALATFLSACSGFAPHARTTSPIADERLAALLQDYREARGALVDMPREEVIVDSGRIQSEIERLTLEFPHHVPSLMAAAQLAYDHGDQAKAQAYLDRARQRDPYHADAAVLRARIALDQGSLPLARRLVDQQVERTPDHAELRELQASVRFLDRRYDDAERALDAAAQLGAPAGRVLYHRGLIAERRGDLATARTHYQHALDADPGHERARSRLTGLGL